MRVINIPLRVYRFLSVIFISMISLPAFASVANQDIIYNLGQVARICEIVSVMIGASLLVGALMRLKRYGEMRGNMMAAQTTATGPVMMLLAGLFMLSLPALLNILGVSIFGRADTEDLVGYDALKPILMMMRVIGVVSVMKGVVQLSRYSEQNAAQGIIGKSLLSIGIGIALVHIITTAKLINSIFGNLLF